MIKQIVSVSRPFPDGQRVTAAAVEYDHIFKAQEFESGLFEVMGRTVTRVFTCDCPCGSEPEEGHYIIVELDPKDANSSTLRNQEGKYISAPPEKIEHGDVVMHGGPPVAMFADGRVFQGPVGLYCIRDEIILRVKQDAEITASDGTVEAAWEYPVFSDKEINILADLFEEREFEGMKYNIFVPEDYDPNVRYPLLLFIHDAGASGKDARITLEQGMGATVFASPQEQKKHPCIIVAPQHGKAVPIANDKYWCTDDEHTIKRLVDSVCAAYSIGTDRIYTTGQSMGFMTSVQLMIDYPELFAAALLPAGHWDIEKTAGLWNRKIWMYLSEEDGGGFKMINALPQAIERKGGKLGVYNWNADIPTAEMGKLIDSVKDDGNSFRMTIFPGDSIWRLSQPDRTDGGGHPGTWHFVYQIEAARDWLFEQKKN